MPKSLYNKKTRRKRTARKLLRKARAGTPEGYKAGLGGQRIRSKGRGRGLGVGRGMGPVGRMR